MGIEEITNSTGEYRSVEHREDTYKRTNEQWGESDNLLDYLQLQEQIATPLYHQHIKIDGM